MSSGIIIHISLANEKRTEFFRQESVRLGTDESCDLQIHTRQTMVEGLWLELEALETSYRIVTFNDALDLLLNGAPLRRFIAIRDGDIIVVNNTEISFAFFAFSAPSSLITVNRELPVAPFIAEAALDAAATPKRDDAKAFLREFVRELAREVSWTTKLIVLTLVIASLSGIFYLGFAVNRELKESRETAERQNQTIQKLEQSLGQTSEQIGQIDKSNKDILKTVSLAPNLRVEYGSGVCLIFGVYDLVDKKTGKTLRYPDPQANASDSYEPATEEGIVEIPTANGLTTEGNGAPVEYDFIGTGFHVGGGYIVTNRHVLQPWQEDDLVKQMIRDSDGRARIKRLNVYFPNQTQAIPLKIKQIGYQEDLAVAAVDVNLLAADTPFLPLDSDSAAVQVGKTVVSMGYPNGPDRLLAMVDDDEARTINSRFGGSRQLIINYLAQNQKIVPLTTQGAITDLDSRRIVHDAKTAEGGSGAPLFGQSGKVIGVNFGVFTQSNAANMAIPVKFAVELLNKAGWSAPDSGQNATAQTNQTADATSAKSN